MNAEPQRPILVVEDNEDVRETIVESLGDAGYLAEGVPDGADALHWLRTAGALPAVILLDLMMPRVNGFQFREEQLKDPALAAIPVIVLSADTTTREKAASLGAAGFLKKPIKLDALVELAERFAAQPSGHGSS